MAFNQDKANAICELLTEGKSLRKACEMLRQQDASFPAVPTFLLWCHQVPALAEQYARAKSAGIDARFDGLRDMQEEKPERGPDGKVDAGYVQWRRLQADALKWELSKLEPKRFGEKLELDGQLSHKVEKVVREVIDPK